MKYEIENLEEILKKIIEINEPNKNDVKNLLQNFYDCKNKLIASRDFNIEEKKYLLERVNHAIDQLNILLIKIEQDEISKGLYQRDVNIFTPFSILTDNIFFSTEKLNGELYHNYLLFNEYGFRCTLAIPASPQVSPLEIHLNFYGTIDLASHVNNFDIGGPGEEIIKKYQVQLMQKLNDMIEQISPENAIWLRVSGFSQGGALAKQCVHILQKACALQREDSVQEIIQKIKTNLNLTSQKPPNSLSLLQDILTEEGHQFKKLSGLTKIQGITLYAHGAPGVSHHVDNMATLMTYYDEPDFLRVYHAFPLQDIFVKFGEVEFLSGKNGIPRTIINKAILFNIITLSNSDLLPLSDLLPIPSVTGRNMAAHKIDVYDTYMTDSIYREESSIAIIKNVNNCEELEKFNIPPIKHRVYRLLFSAIGLVTSSNTIQKLFPDLDITPSHPIEKTRIELRYFPQFDRLGNELTNTIFLNLNVTDQWSFISVNKKYYGLFNEIHSKIIQLSRFVSCGSEYVEDIEKILEQNPKLILTRTNTNIMYGNFKNTSSFQISVSIADIKITILLLEYLKLLPHDEREFIQQELLKQFNEMDDPTFRDSASLIALMEKNFLFYIGQYINNYYTSEAASCWWERIRRFFYYIPSHVRENCDLKANFSSYEPQPLKLVEADYKSITEFCQKTKEYFESIKTLLETPSGLVSDLRKIKSRANY